MKTGKHGNYEKMRVTNGGRIFKTTYHNGSYLFLFGKGKLRSFMWTVPLSLE